MPIASNIARRLVASLVSQFGGLRSGILVRLVVQRRRSNFTSIRSFCGNANRELLSRFHSRGLKLVIRFMTGLGFPPHLNLSFDHGFWLLILDFIGGRKRDILGSMQSSLT